MTTSIERERGRGFGVWLTGLPASGKSTVAMALRRLLWQRGMNPAVLESDELRKVLTPNPTYSDAERDTFYGAMLYIGRLLVEHGAAVIFAATANRRRYRDAARAAIERFIEVYVECPIEVCQQRDPKGIYANARRTGATHVPGAGADYEPPVNPELVVRGDRDDADEAAARILALLDERGWLR